MSLNTEVIVTCAVTGAGDTVGKHPAIPVTPEQIAGAAIEAAGAGAAIAHVHVRAPETGKGSMSLDLFREVVERIRESDTDVIINLTGGGGANFYPSEEDPRVGGPGTTLMRPEERTVHIETLKPEICSLDVATHNEGDHVYMNTAPALRVMAKRIKDAGVKPELECFDLGQVRLAGQLRAEGLIEDPPMYQLCLGIAWAADADAESMLVMRNMLPDNAIWAAFGISRMQMPMVAQSVLLGGNVRVGLEDNLYLERGVFASNGQLVEKAVGIIEALGARALGPDETREKLGLKKPH